MIVFIVSQVHHGSKYSECKSVDWLADDQPFTLQVARHNETDLKDGFVLEQVGLSEVRESDFRNLAVAKKVEYRICGDEFTLGPGELSDMRKVAELMSPQPVK